MVEFTKWQQTGYVGRDLRHCLIFHDTLFISFLLKPEYPMRENTSVLGVLLLQDKHTASGVQLILSDTLVGFASVKAAVAGWV